MLASWATVLLGVLLPGLAVRPSQQNLWPLEAAGSQRHFLNAQERDSSKEFHTKSSSISEAQQAVADAEADDSATEKTGKCTWRGRRSR